jgi:xanthine permease XanP
VQGTSFSFLSPIIAAGKSGGLPLIFGLCAAGSFIEMAASRSLGLFKKIITPLVSGIVVLLIGLTLIKAGVTSCAGGQAARAAGTYGSALNMGTAFLVILLIVIFNRSKYQFLRMSSIFLGLAGGYVFSIYTGAADISKLSLTVQGRALSEGFFVFPDPLKYGMAFDIKYFIPIALVYLITTIESIGDLTATSSVSGEPVEGPLYTQRLAGGVLGDAVNSLIASIFNTFPNTTFSQNNGIIQLTGVASRRAGIFLSGLLVLAGLFPVTGIFISSVPESVLGGAALILFGTIAGSGIRIIGSENINSRGIMILALSLGLGIGAGVDIEALSFLPESIRPVFSSPITTGGITALVCNYIIPD